jgi:hypothetical protein
MKKFLSSLMEKVFGNLFEISNNYDPYKERKSQEASQKFIIFVLELFFLFSPLTRPWILLFWLSGALTVCLRSFITCYRETESWEIFIQEIICAWKSGELMWDVLIFWPFDLIILGISLIFGKYVTFRTSYKRDKFFAYNSGRGKYYGMHMDTAWQFAENDIQESQNQSIILCQSSQQLKESTKRKSRLALIYASILTFLAAPFNLLRSEQESKKEKVAGVNFSGFGQVKFNPFGFSIPKVRISFNGPVETGLNGIQFSYKTHADFNSAGEIKLGAASLIVQYPKEWLPKIILGRTLDPMTYQFPALFKLPTLNYPVARFNKPLDTGLFFQEVYANFWTMAAVTNGNGEFQDNNKCLDFSGRITYCLPLGFQAGGIYRQGEQPDGQREIWGADVSWQQSWLWINGGQNIVNCKGQQVGRWLWSTFDFSSHLQGVGLIESLTAEGQTGFGWTIGINFFPTEKTTLRAGYFKSVKEDLKSWGILFQQTF